MLAVGATGVALVLPAALLGEPAGAQRAQWSAPAEQAPSVIRMAPDAAARRSRDEPGPRRRPAGTAAAAAPAPVPSPPAQPSGATIPAPVSAAPVAAPAPEPILEVRSLQSVSPTSPGEPALATPTEAEPGNDDHGVGHGPGKPQQRRADGGGPVAGEHYRGRVRT